MVRKLHIKESNSNKHTNKSYIKEGINVNKITNEVNKAISQAVRDVQNDDASGTWHWYLDSDDRYDYELVLGFSGGFEPNENEFTDSYGNQLCLKWARISNRSAMNDYDVDYEFVTDPETGDAWISETSINSYDATDDVKWLINDFNEFAEQYLNLDESCIKESKGNSGIITLKNMDTDVIPVVDFGCYGGMLSDALGDVFVYDVINLDAFDPSDEYYDEVTQLVADEYDGTDEFYNQVLRYAPSKIQEAFNEYGIPAQVVSGSCRWHHPRFYNYSDDCIEFDMTIDTDWVRAKFNEFSNDSKFRKFINDTFSSRSGFISFMPDDVDSYSELLDSDSDGYWKVVSAIIQYIISEDMSIRNDITMDLVYDIEENADYISMRSFM